MDILPAKLTAFSSDDIALRDKTRDRPIPMRIYYPLEGDTFPAIIFSHGAGGSKESFASLCSFWASQGYICIYPIHLGSDSSILKEGGLQALKECVRNPQVRRDRLLDISFLISSLETLEHRVFPLKGKIDRTRIGVSGHSYGAYTTMLIAGALVNKPWDKTTSFRDRRATAFLAISPQGTTQEDLDEYSWGFDRESWQEVTVPVMTISGDRDLGQNDRSPSWRLEPFRYMPPGDKYHVLIQGANHFSYTDHLGIDRISHRLITKEQPNLRRQKRIHQFVQSASIAFWNAYLKEENSAKVFLKSDALPVHSQGDVSLLSN